MAKNIENTRIKKLPTSQLILYMGSPELDDGALKSKIDDAVFKRLTRKYKMYPSAAVDFIDREQRIIDNRGYNLENYAFGNDIPYSDLIRIFYENTAYPLRASIEDNFNNLTLSEIVEFYFWFVFYRRRFEERHNAYSQLSAKSDNLQRRVLDRRVSLEEKSDKMIKLQGVIDAIEKYHLRESQLIDYNTLYEGYMIEKAIQIMESYSDKKVGLSLLRESFLVTQGSKEEFAQYRDLDFDAYSKYISIPSEYDLPDFPLSRK